MQGRLLVLLIFAMNLTATASAQDNDNVWVWNQQCSNPTTVTLRVRLDDTTIFSKSIPICRWERKFEEGNDSFHFTPTRTIIWYGYRSDESDGTKDPGDSTAAGTPLIVEFWQAGGEKDAIELGYSVSASDGLHMNSIHLLSPTQKSATTMAPGLVLETLPEKKP
jgi:hypothetical protein